MNIIYLLVFFFLRDLLTPILRETYFKTLTLRYVSRIVRLSSLLSAHGKNVSNEMTSNKQYKINAVGERNRGIGSGYKRHYMVE